MSVSILKRIKRGLEITPRLLVKIFFKVQEKIVTSFKKLWILLIEPCENTIIYFHIGSSTYHWIQDYLPDHLTAEERKILKKELVVVAKKCRIFQGDKSSQKKRNVLFMYQNYYHFKNLSKALRKRGWDVLFVSNDPDGSIWNKYYHGSDINLAEGGNNFLNERIDLLYFLMESRFTMLHFSGDYCMSMYPKYWGEIGILAPDIMRWKERGAHVAYTVSGCNSGTSKESVARWSSKDNVSFCSRCVWDKNSDVCNPAKSLTWGKLVSENCDLICAEGLPALDYMDVNQTVFEPLTTCIDHEYLTPSLSVPDEFRIEKNDYELVIYHGFGEKKTRTSETRDNKGSKAIFSAVNHLISEGFKIRYIHTHDVPNTEVRYIQVQADIIVDQLNYGRYGAQAREAMMLGKPVISYINKAEEKEGFSIKALDECPIVSATESTIYDVLKSLIEDNERRRMLGKQGRDFALKWHSSVACAARYERVYDALMAGEDIRTVALPLKGDPFFDSANNP